MKIKSYNEYINENYEINQYQYKIKTIFNEMDISLYYAATFGTSLTSLVPLIEQLLINKDINIENIILLTIFGFSVLCKENKERTSYLYNKLIEKGISDEIINLSFNFMKNINTLYNIISKQFDKESNNFHDMIINTYLFVPYTKIILSILQKNQLDINLLIMKNDNFNMEVENSDKISLILNKIIRKLHIMINYNNKFLNKDNVDVLLADQEFKPPMYKKIRYDAE